jgi:ribose/xylose/arabinose/galactoside ABC-type transport system permease subunit
MPDLQNSNKEMNGLIASLLGLQVVDGATTVWGVQHHVLQELNPMAVEFTKTWWNIPIKVIPTLLVCLLMIWVIKKYPRLNRPLMIGLSCFVVIMAVVAVNNFVQIGLHYKGVM